MKILLVNDTSDWCHWGCTITSSILKERMEQLNYDIDYFPARETYKSAWKNRPHTFEKFKDEETFLNFCQTNISLIEKINAADGVVINGEGTIHGLKDPPLNLLYLAYISKTFFHKHVEIINHSVFPEDSSLIENDQTRMIYQLVYQQLDFVAVREPLSLDILKKLGVRACLSFDCLPIYINEHYTRRRNTKTKKLVLAGSAAWHTSNSEAIINYINEMYERGFEINLLIGAKEYYFEDSQLVDFLDDDKVVSFFKNNFSPIKWQLIDAKSINEWLDTIAQAELLVSGRFHHSIAAACLGTRFIALNSNTPKIDGLLQTLELPAALQYGDKDLFGKLMVRTEDVSRDSFLDEPEVVVQKLSRLAENNFDGLKAFKVDFPANGQTK